jgi:hypothetical protein
MHATQVRASHRYHPEISPEPASGPESVEPHLSSIYSKLGGVGEILAFSGVACPLPCGRAYARNVAVRDAADAIRDALTRLFDHYLSAAGPEVSDPASARAWLDAERANLVAAAAHCAIRHPDGKPRGNYRITGITTHVDASYHQPAARRRNS